MIQLLGLAAFLLAGAAGAQQVAPQLGAGISRESLLRNDLEFEGREAIHVRVTFAPGASAARHSHPGAELVYVLSGELEYSLDCQPASIVKAGETLFIPAGTFHAVKNLGKAPAAELATYIVDKRKPLIKLGD